MPLHHRLYLVAVAILMACVVTLTVATVHWMRWQPVDPGVYLDTWNGWECYTRAHGPCRLIIREDLKTYRARMDSLRADSLERKIYGR